MGELGREGASASVLGPQLPEGVTRCNRRVHRVVTLNNDIEDAIVAYVIGQLTRVVGLFHDYDSVSRVVSRLAVASAIAGSALMGGVTVG